ncbi:MAG: ParB/RepB/Spo0J family partition protein [Bacteroidales bacterium]|nr:ParB/RepB/Spo0J family partition protein [Bacteroidales bacterium]
MAKVQRNALGRGLSALLQDAEEIQHRSTTPPETGKLLSAGTQLSLALIEPNPYQPRVTFDEEAIEELSESIKILGIIQPITVRKTENGKFQIISGERRFRAAKKAGLTTIPAYVREADDAGMLEMAIVENIQRENLDAIETALSFQRLIDECSLTQEQMADRVGKKRATVTNYLRLLNLPVEIQKALKIGKLSVGHAKALLSLPSEESQLDLCGKCIENDWSVRKLEEMARKVTDSNDTPSDAEQVSEERPLPDEYYKVLEIVGKYFHNNISLKRSANGSGKITIRFKNDDEIARFLRALNKEN